MIKDYKEVEKKIKDEFNFKKKYLSDKSGYFFTKNFTTKYFTVYMVCEPDRGVFYVELLPIFKNKNEYIVVNHVGCSNSIDLLKAIKESNSYWKKLSSEKKQEYKNK